MLKYRLKEENNKIYIIHRKGIKIMIEKRIAPEQYAPAQWFVNDIDFMIRTANYRQVRIIHTFVKHLLGPGS